MFLLILSSISIPQGGATPSSTIVSVVPKTITVGEEGVPLPTDPFTVNITVTNVTGMYGWQVKIYFNTTILNCTGAVYPADHVFAGKFFVPAGPMIEQNYVLVGAQLISEADLFSGNGTLCQITFIGKAVGTSNLTLDAESTFLIDYDIVKMDKTLEHGEVIVIPEFPPSLIALLLITATLAAAVLRKKLHGLKNN
jgi:hypothetical protein